VVRADGGHRTALRFEDECARHKVLDLLGDLGLLGFPIHGRVVGIRSGHSLNRRLVQAIWEQRESMENKKPRAAESGPMNIEAIKAVLPHRDPFLFLDRILERGEKTIVASKKLDGRESFFKGHFPGKPVMPGVLMIEALAQAGGVLMLSRSENQGKIAYLASVSNARFRKIVRPGDELRLEVEVIKMKSKVGVMRGVAKVAGEEVCDAEIMFSLGD
jgi:UDP-3-O-[3-hydroxymyristoyl] N-acetylglucosamine deacetylase/3-hydroxyacyl-[acyl-carrier-protein] dehydratase